MKKAVSRTGKLLGGFIPATVAAGIEQWVQQNPERDKSTFIREAAREKLRRDGIPFHEVSA